MWLKRLWCRVTGHRKKTYRGIKITCDYCLRCRAVVTWHDMGFDG